jgi:hypothetical protein
MRGNIRMDPRMEVGCIRPESRTECHLFPASPIECPYGGKAASMAVLSLLCWRVVSMLACDIPDILSTSLACLATYPIFSRTCRVPNSPMWNRELVCRDRHVRHTTVRGWDIPKVCPGMSRAWRGHVADQCRACRGFHISWCLLRGLLVQGNGAAQRVNRARTERASMLTRR